MSALPYRIKKNAEERAYKIYMSDTVMSLAKCIIRPAQEPPRYWDIINPKPEETRTADEIIEHMKNKLRKME